MLKSLSLVKIFTKQQRELSVKVPHKKKIFYYKIL